MDVQFALATLSGTEVAKMDEVDRLFLEEGGDSSLSYEFKPLRLTAAAGGAKMFQDADGNSVPAPLKGFVIDALKTRAYWPEKDGNKVPFCSSLGAVNGWVNPQYTEDDLRAAAQAMTPHQALIDLDASGQLRESYDCASCPMAQFGSEYQSGGSSGGQACKSKVLFLFLPEGWHQPCLLSVSTMSMKPWFQYASSIRQMTGREFYTVKTQIEIEKMENRRGNPYGMLKFSNLGAIKDMELARAVLTLRKELKEFLYSRDVAIADDEAVEASGRIVDPDTGEVLEAA